MSMTINENVTPRALRNPEDVQYHDRLKQVASKVAHVVFHPMQVLNNTLGELCAGTGIDMTPPTRSEAISKE